MSVEVEDVRSVQKADCLVVNLAADAENAGRQVSFVGADIACIFAGGAQTTRADFVLGSEDHARIERGVVKVQDVGRWEGARRLILVVVAEIGDATVGNIVDGNIRKAVRCEKI